MQGISRGCDKEKTEESEEGRSMGHLMVVARSRSNVVGGCVIFAL